MGKTISVCSWLLIALGLAVCGWLGPHPLTFLPFILLALAARKAQGILACVWVLLLTLASVCASFYFLWDAKFIHWSTLNLWPIQAAIVESVAALITWFAVRHPKKTTIEPAG
jgi:hypothetical protein